MNKDEKILTNLLSGKAAKKYEGKQVVISEGKIYILPKNDNKSKEALNKLIAKHPKTTPTITFVPKHGTYIYPTSSWPPALLGTY